MAEDENQMSADKSNISICVVLPASFVVLGTIHVVGKVGEEESSPGVCPDKRLFIHP